MITYVPECVRIGEDPNLVPHCPYCNDAVTNIRARRMPAAGRPLLRFGTRYLYACPRCNKLLGISHRKGFWMG